MTRGYCTMCGDLAILYRGLCEICVVEYISDWEFDTTDWYGI